MSTSLSRTSDHARRTDTGLANHVYDLVLLLQQACEDVVRYEAFSRDAEEAGDEEMAAWMQELADSDRQIAERARGMLRSRL